MIVLKIIGWILLSLLAIVIALLFVKVRIIAEYGENPTARLKWLFFDLPLYPKEEKQPKAEKTKKEKKKKKSAPAEETVITDTPPAAQEVQPLPEESEKKESLLHMFYRCNNGAEGIIQLLKRVVSYFDTFLGGVLRSIVVSELYMDITVGTRDAAQTALRYGEICSAAFPLLGAIVSKYKIRKYDFNIEPDFLAYKSEYGMYTDIYVRPAFLIGRTLALGLKLIFGVVLKIVFNMLRPLIKQKAENKDKSKKKSEKSGATT